MMVDVLLEEDENSLSSSPVVPYGDVLLTEKARKLFQMCDHNGKGFVVKMDLTRIGGMISNMSQQQLERFFDNADISKTNYITENQFIENIKPILLRNDFSDDQPTKNEETKEELHLTKDNEAAEGSHGGKMVKANERSADSVKKTTVSTILSKTNSVRIPTDLETVLQGKESMKTVERQHQRINLTGQKGHHYEKHYQHQESQRIYDGFTGSLKDELSVAAIGTSSNEPTLHANAEPSVGHQLIIDNTSSSSTPYVPPSPTAMEIRQNLKLDDLRRRDRETSSQLDLRKSIYHPDVKTSPGSRSLADELRECGVINNDVPPSEPRPDFSPDRIFKVVFVGDSAVGKTCFLHRFCHNRFKPLFNATIGVDFTVKTIRLDNRIVAVQLWDTAGQERFRSITKQYFRKADGVILMYDVTSEQSFLNVRNWIASVKAGVEENCVMCLVGNKVDLFANDQSRVLTYKHGQKLAEEFGMLFFETSAFTGFGVNDCMKAVATKLQEREDQQLEDVLKLDMNVQIKKRSWCCV